MSQKKDSAAKKTKEVTVRTSKGLRDALFESFDDLRNDVITPQKGKTVAMVAGKILDTVKLEFIAARFISATGVQVEKGGLAKIPPVEL